MNQLTIGCGTTERDERMSLRLSQEVSTWSTTKFCDHIKRNEVLSIRNSHFMFSLGINR